MSPDSPRVESFILRFVHDAPDQGVLPSRAWHGVVIRVQTNEEKTFVHFADAVAFIARYVPVGEFQFQSQKDEV